MEEEKKNNFLEEIIEADLAAGKYDSIITRFPPEPNGYLHLGHAKSLCINFGLALKYGGKTNLRYDDTNPTKEDVEYVDAIKEDIKWLGFQWAEERYASDYFDQLYEWAEQLIERGLAYVDDQTLEEMRASRGTVETPGTDSPWRNRSVEENLRLFREMKAGKYPDGAKVLRAKIDMAHPNMMFRDPILYRIKHAHHHRTSDKWCIYPMYDYTHGQCDSIEHITHSICTLEFDIHRPLYDWFIETLGIYPSHQYEFARLNLTYTLMSKRKLLELVEKGYVSGWDDPRMPTLCGVRRRGYTPEALKMFCEKIGVSKRDQLMDIGLLEWCVRQDLNERSNRYMVVSDDPIKVTITNWEPGKVEWFEAPLNPAAPDGPKRRIPFTGELLIDRARSRQGRLRQSGGTPLHLRSPHAPGLRPVALRQGHHPLGEHRLRQRDRMPSLRPPLHPRRHVPGPGRQRLQGLPQSRKPRRPPRLGRTRPPRRPRRPRRPVRTRRLLPQRPRLHPRPPGHEQNRPAEGFLQAVVR